MDKSEKKARDAARHRRILLVGAPRSGTTWVGEILTLVPDVEYIHEPDNEKSSIIGLYGKAGLPRFPLLSPGEARPAYGSLWHIAFTAPGAAVLSSSWLTRLWLFDRTAKERFVQQKERMIADGYRPDPAHCANGSPMPALVNRLAALKLFGTPAATVRLVKSVHGVLAAEWIERSVAAHSVVVVMRNPHGVLASWRRMKMPDAMRSVCLTPEVLSAAFGDRAAPIQEELKRELEIPLNKTALQLAVMYRILLDSAARNPHWTVIYHEHLCMDPVLEFRGLFARLGLPWSKPVQDGIAARNREGKGYRTVRVAGKELGKWRKDFTSAEMDGIKRVFTACGFELGTAECFPTNN